MSALMRVFSTGRGLAGSLMRQVESVSRRSPSEPTKAAQLRSPRGPPTHRFAVRCNPLSTAFGVHPRRALQAPLRRPALKPAKPRPGTGKPID